MSPGHETTVETQERAEYLPYPPQSNQQMQPLQGNSPQHHATNNFAQAWGLHPGIALLTVILDTMLFGGQLATVEAIYPLVLVCAFGLGVVTFLFQKKYYGDDDQGALIKAIIVAGLTAIPTSLPGFITIPAGIVGFFRKSER